MMFSPEILNAALSTYNWLGYLGKSTDCSDLLAESSLKYPFIECLERHNVKDIHLEVLHPLFPRKRIDVCIVPETNNTVDFSSDTPICVEFKFVREDTGSKEEFQRYFNDLLRLAYLKQCYQSTTCYFMVYGSSILFKGNFMCAYKKPNQKTKEIVGSKHQYSHKSKYHDLLSFSPLKKIKEICLCKKKFTNYLSVFDEEYLNKSRPNISLNPLSRFTTKLIYLSKDQNYNSFSMGIWEVTF